MSDHQEPFNPVEEPTQQQPQSQQNKTTKKQHSYTYWVDEKNKSRTLPPQQQPQKIEAPKPVIQKIQNGRSDWNTAGTWQHKKISLNDIEKQYTEKVNNWVKENCPEAIVKKVELKGECEVIFTSKKKALTYEINGKVQFEKKVQEEKGQEKSEPKTQKVEPKDQVVQGEEKSVSSSSEDVSSDKEKESKSPESKSKSTQTKKSKPKPQTMTFEIVDLTDHGDRQFKSKADNADDKKFISQKSESLMCLLEGILKSYK